MEKANNKSPYIKPPEVQEIFECKRTKAYSIIRDLNHELDDLGYRTYKGKVSRAYFNKRYGLNV